MEDIRINKNKIKSNTFKSSFLKMNFVFYNKLFLKYDRHLCEDSNFFNQSSMIFLLKSEFDDDEILKSILKILDVLKKKEDNNELDNEISNVEVHKEDNIVTSVRPLYKNNVLNNFSNKRNLFYNQSKENNTYKELIKLLISSINEKNENKISKKITNKKQFQDTSIYQKNINKKTDYKLQKSSKKEIDFKFISDKDKSKNSTLDKNPKDNDIDVKNSEILTDKNTVIKTSEKIDVNKITSRLKKINEQIIERKIKKIDVNKIGYDIINKSISFNKKIKNKVNKTISSIIDSDSRVRYFSKASKDIVLFNKKFKNQNIIKDLQNIVLNYKKDKTIISKKVLSKSSKIENQLFERKRSKFNVVENHENSSIKYKDIKKLKINRKDVSSNELISTIESKILNRNINQIYDNIVRKNKINSIFSENNDIYKSFVKYNYYDLLNNRMHKKLGITNLIDKILTIKSVKGKKILENERYYLINNIKNRKTFDRLIDLRHRRMSYKRYDDVFMVQVNSKINELKNKKLKILRNINTISSLNNEKIYESSSKIYKKNRVFSILKNIDSRKLNDQEDILNFQYKRRFNNYIYKNNVEIEKRVDKLIDEKISKINIISSKNIFKGKKQQFKRVVENGKEFIQDNENWVTKDEVKNMIRNTIRPLSVRRIADLVSEKLDITDKNSILF